MNEAAAACRLDRLIWTIVAIAGAIVVSAPVFSRFYIEWTAFLAPMLACLALAAGGWVYTRLRPDPRLASGLISTAQVVAIAAVGAPLSYLAVAAASNSPLIDARLDAIDQAIGLDWGALLGFFNARPTLFAILRAIYLSLTLQMTTAVLCLAFRGRHVWLRVYTLAFLIAALTTIALSAVLPAAGAWPFHAYTDADAGNILPTVSTSWPVFYGLRDGSFRALVAVGSEGIITFPSLHAALAVILIAAVWPLPRLRWAILSLDSVMLLATPIDGSHYFVDVGAGIAVAAASLLAARAIAAKADRVATSPRLVEVPQIAGNERQIFPP